MKAAAPVSAAALTTDRCRATGGPSAWPRPRTPAASRARVSVAAGGSARCRRCRARPRLEAKACRKALRAAARSTTRICSPAVSEVAAYRLRQIKRTSCRASRRARTPQAYLTGFSEGCGPLRRSKRRHRYQSSRHRAAGRLPTSGILRMALELLLLHRALLAPLASPGRGPALWRSSRAKCRLGQEGRTACGLNLRGGKRWTVPRSTPRHREAVSTACWQKSGKTGRATSVAKKGVEEWQR
mmetsp:Transcript_158883/g.509510  ORF Transcript_158883/g.509510 Transcript_158883/m.509510 type:complete len:242 (+) Transcript_158883:2953-3678(+)